MQRVRLAGLSGDGVERLLLLGSWCRLLPSALDAAEGTLSLPPAALGGVGLKPGLELNLFGTDDGRRLHLGPLIGVMLGPADMVHLTERERYRIMAAQARAAGAWPLFFDLDGVQEEGAAVRGWVEQDGQWRQMLMPFPDLVYNRATYGDREVSKSAQHLLRTLVNRRRTRLLNGVNALSKMDVYTALCFFPRTAHLAPETVALTGPEELTAMLSRHGLVFVKDNHGSHGSDVVRLRAEGGRVGIRGRIDSQRVDEQFSTPDQIVSFLELLRPRADWVVQQGIDLPEVEGRLFDLRAIAQKDGSGLWQVPLVLVRLAQQGQVAANMSQGGEPFLPEAFLQRFGQQHPGLESLAEKAVDAARQTALALESRFGMLGEIGVDIGLDREGSARVFEANTKPLHPAVPGMEEDRLLRLPFQYAVHLASQAWTGRYSGLSLPLPD